MITKEQAHKKVSELVDRFTDQYDSYKKSDYNETLTRRDFIDPFFKALGWDIDNEQGYAEAYREVIHEDRVKISGAFKAPDYSFRLVGGKKLFFVEAKKPSVVVKDEIPPAYQIRRYGWSAKLSISIITDFEEFSIYDCTIKPNPTDKASTARIRYLTFRDYLKEFDFIWETFSKEQVLKGSFDKFVKSDTQRKGTATVDKEFLQSLDSWRTYLATSIAINNKNLDEDEINFAVQQIIDRIIFLRIAEDRGVEPYGNLKQVLQGDHYKNLFELFQTADEKYNSGIFDFKKDRISEHLKIENKIIKTIITDLYYPSPYAFDAMPVEILGTAYEQFLGKVIRITPAHHAKIEEKPEVRKAGGVYYTPQYVVDYIVKNTVGKLIGQWGMPHCLTPKEISKIKIVDPACGSGSFLLGAYQYLLDFHKFYYCRWLKPTAMKGQKNNSLTPEGNLTTAEKKRILLNNIFGVDIDVNAVEVTKLSLLLKCMEGETSASIAHQLSMFNERVLPDLDNNIKSGNSLIDTNFYDGQIDFGDEKKIKPFNWKRAFPEVFNIKIKPIVEPSPIEKLKKALINIVEAEKELDDTIRDYIKTVEEPKVTYGLQGGFDIVIGNPPYLGGREWKEENGNVYDYFIKHYQIAEYQFDIYALFWEKGIKLLKPNGMIGFITPNTWLNNQSNKKLRRYILEETRIAQIVDYSKVKVFDQATVLPIITILEKRIDKKLKTEIFEPSESGLQKINSVAQSIWKDKDLNIININLNEKDLLLRDKIESNTVSLENLALIKFGIKLYETGKGNPKQKPSFAEEHIYEANKKIDKTYRPYLEGKDINPYSIEYKNRWLKYGENLAAPRDPILFEGERILVRRIVGKTLISAYTDSNYVTSQLLQIVKPYDQSSTKFLLGILNSDLLAFYFRKKYNRQDKTFPEIRIYELASLPIKIIDDKNKAEKALHDEIVKLVEQLLKLNEEKAEAKLQTKIKQIESKIDYCESRINEIVYQLYDLTAEEIKIVEGK